VRDLRAWERWGWGGEGGKGGVRREGKLGGLEDGRYEFYDALFAHSEAFFR